MAPPCRLFVIPAKKRPVAVILRRGPSAWYHVILWHTDTDEMEHGAWFRGRIYEERCDVSPDGEFFLYFALQGRKWKTDYLGSWTAVSRPPWLHALALWPEGNTWGGGGRFTANRSVTLGISRGPTHPDHPATGLKVSFGSCRSWSLEDDLAPKEWSGRDHGGAEVFTRAGKLFRRRGKEDFEIADFNGLKPDPQPAPRWATQALSAPSSRRRRT